MKTKCLQGMAIALLAMLGAGIAVASDQVVEKPVMADTPEKFAQTAKEIREEMSDGGRYEYMKPADKASAESDLNSISAMLQKGGSVSAMNQQEKIQLFNTQEHLNGILTHSDSNRLVCERRAPVGTNIPVTKCKTLGQVEKERRDSQKYMQDQDRSGWKCHGGTCAGQ